MYLVWCARASAYLARADLAARAPRLRPLATRCRCPTHAHYHGGRSVALPAAAIAAAAIAAAIITATAIVAAVVAAAIATATIAGATAPARAQPRALPARVR